MLPAKERNSQKAFTLVELLIYIGIFSVVAGLVLGILNSTIRSNQAEVANNEVTTQLNTVLTDIQTQVSQSSNIGVYPDFSSINTPTSTGSFLKLRMSSTSTDPTCIYLSSSTVYMAQGPDPSNASQCNQANATALTTSQVLANNLTFTQITVPGGHASVSISLQITYNSSNPAFAISKTLQSSIGRVSSATFNSSLIPGADNTFDIGQLSPALRWENVNFAGTITIGTSGSLGIGTETPSGYFDIASSTATVFIVSNNGNVGINNASPSATLDVNEGSGNNLGLALRSNGAGWGSGLQLVNTSTTGRSYGIYAGADGNLHFADVASSSDRMIISSAGNVGIGTVPSASLDVVNSTAADQTPIVIFGDGSNSNRYQFLADRGSGAVFQFTSSGIDSIRSAGDLRFEVNGSTSPTLYITSGGYVGIGTTTPDQILTVAGTLHVTSGGIEFPDGTVQTTTCTNIIPTNGNSTWSTPGTYTWTVPSGVTRVIATVWGGGGSSAAGEGGAYPQGGGGGAFSLGLLNVVPGGSVSITVGSGGAQVTSSGQAGQSSSVTSGSQSVSANGGGGGVYSSAPTANGASASSGSNIFVSQAGGTGGTGYSNDNGGSGGGGGGSGGPGGNGARVSAGGLGGANGGSGGGGTGGQSATLPPTAGNQPGGGGASDAGQAGMAGGNGEVVLYW